MGEPNRMPFARKIATYASITAGESLFPGSHLYTLSEFLSRTSRPQLPVFPGRSPREQSSREYPLSQSNFAALYDLHDFHNIHWLDSPTDLKGFIDRHSERNPEKSFSAILFLHGMPSPGWLERIGELFDLDGSFFDHHLSFLCRTNSQQYQSHPNVLPYRSDIYQVQLSSIMRVSQNEYGGSNNRHDFMQMLSQHRSHFQHYLQSMHSDAGRKTGTSIVRSCTLHNINTATIDQAVTVSATAFRDGWIGFVWSDIGLDIGDIVHQGWFGRDTREAGCTLSSQPTLFNPLNASIWDWHSKADAAEHSPRKIAQSISHLAAHYSGLIYHETAVIHSFFALLGVLRLARNSKSAYMDLIRCQIDDLLENEPDFVVVPEMLLIAQKSLSRIEDDLFAASHALQNFDHYSWPTCDNQAQTLLGQHPEILLLIQQYQDLKNKNEQLSKRCEQALHNIMSRAGIAESQKAIIQAQSVERLTRLAFVFIPLSFISTFFGMNFKQLGMPGALSIWVWFVIAIPALFLSILYLSSGVRSRISDAMQRLRI